MIAIGIAIVIGILILCSTVASFYLIFLLFREKGIGHALLGFFFFPYAIVWGWMNAKRLEIFDIMVFGTVT
ncbi:MAG: hypothetical protein GY943_18155, partial [Chloroflexi bacterium]|nr:hypothetical protein [Chloroflexota bacterium]